MLPLTDDNRGRRTTPIVTWALIAINVLVFIYQFLMSEQELNQFFNDFGVIPRDISNGEGYLTLLTSMFLHGGLLHVGGNMLFLWVFGDNVEDVMGHARYLIFYLLTGLGASAAQILINPDSTIPTIGASGAISGVLAAYIVCFPHGRIRTLITLGFFITSFMLPAWIMIGYWIVLQVIQGSLSLGVSDDVGGVAWFAHIGGFVAGLVLVFLFRQPERVERQRVARNRPDPERRQIGWGRS
ncbi:MAG: rhomboid family intramembrane serine protease [Chloroflexia bacterium]|jgi:membrane associated rhomboid family serine protease|nr:rhomboid family intramembrane serine protease [Chloroflexia bacterium]MDQ3612787.1 rhomboid family intramembrane serine protease [Chloroflexota bacterium]